MSKISIKTFLLIVLFALLNLSYANDFTVHLKSELQHEFRELEDSIKETMSEVKEKIGEVKDKTIEKGTEVLTDFEKAVKIDNQLPLSSLAEGKVPTLAAPAHSDTNQITLDPSKYDDEDLNYLAHEREVAEQMAAAGDSTYLSE